jgi:predicted amino acid dehydrogenase
MIHPLDAKRDTSRKWPWVRHIPRPVVEWGISKLKPWAVSHITGLRSITGAEAEGWFIVCPLVPNQFFSLPIKTVYDRITQCGRIAADLGAKIIGLGALTSVVGDGGITIASRLGIAVTTGNSYTVAVAIDETLSMARRLQIGLPAEVAIVGATGSIGSTCAEILASQSSVLTLVGRNVPNLESLAARLPDLSLFRQRLHLASGMLILSSP